MKKINKILVILLTMFMLFISAKNALATVYVSNSYEELMNNPTLSETFLTGFFAQNWIFLYLPIWVAVFRILAGVVMYINLDTVGYYV